MNFKHPYVLRKAIYGAVCFVMAVLAASGIADEATVESLGENLDKIVTSLVMAMAYVKTAPTNDTPKADPEPVTGGMADYYRGT